MTFRNQPTIRDEYVGIDIIPNDVCPSLFNQISTVRFDSRNEIKTFELDTKLKQTEYEYTLSMTIQVNETSCTAIDP